MASGYERTCTKCEVTKTLAKFTQGRGKRRRSGNVCMACLSERSQALYAEKQARVRAIKVERGCTDCGYNAHAAALQFDHLGDKSFNIGGYNASWERIEAEIAKCEVVCANCHAVRTASRRLVVA